MPEIVFEDEWIATDPQVRYYIERLTGKPFPDPAKYYTVTNINKACNFCGRGGGKLLPDPMGDEDNEHMWACDECWDNYWMDS